jgi:hypothetical protein
VKQVEENDTIRISDFDYRGMRRLIVSHSQNRANKDRYEREKAVGRIRQQLKTAKNPKELIKASGGKKYFKVVGQAQLEIDEAKIQKDTEWDGLHGVFTNINDIGPNVILAHYHGL